MWCLAYMKWRLWNRDTDTNTDKSGPDLPDPKYQDQHPLITYFWFCCHSILKRNLRTSIYFRINLHLKWTPLARPDFKWSYLSTHQTKNTWDRDKTTTSPLCVGVHRIALACAWQFLISSVCALSLKMFGSIRRIDFRHFANCLRWDKSYQAVVPWQIVYGGIWTRVS